MHQCLFLYLVHHAFWSYSVFYYNLTQYSPPAILSDSDSVAVKNLLIIKEWSTNPCTNLCIAKILNSLLPVKSNCQTWYLNCHSRHLILRSCLRWFVTLFRMFLCTSTSTFRKHCAKLDLDFATFDTTPNSVQTNFTFDLKLRQNKRCMFLSTQCTFHGTIHLTIATLQCQ